MKQKDYHESTKLRKHERGIKNFVVFVSSWLIYFFKMKGAV